MTPCKLVGFCKFPILKTGGQVPGRIGEYRGIISGFWLPGWRKSAKKCEEQRFIPPKKCQRGALLSSLFYRGICPSDIKQACMFQKCPRGSANFFIFFKKKSHPSIRGFFVRQKRKSPRGSANSGRKKGDPPREFPILKLSIFRARRHASGLPGFGR